MKCKLHKSYILLYNDHLNNQNTPGVKKDCPQALEGLAERDVKSKWAAKAS